MSSTDQIKPPLPEQQQSVPGTTEAMHPKPDHGEDSYQGRGRLEGKKAIITGGDSGIGRAVAIAFAREGADVLISYLNEDEDARETARLVEDAGRKAVVVPGDIGDPAHCRAIVDKAVEAFGGIDILVNNAAHQMTFEAITDIPDEEWDKTFRTNIHAMFYLTKAAVPHMPDGSAIINTTSVNADTPKPTLLAYATTKGAIQNFTGGLSQLLAEKGIRANCVAPGPVWTPLIPATMPPEEVQNFGKQVPMGRAAQPARSAIALLSVVGAGSHLRGGARRRLLLFGLRRGRAVGHGTLLRGANGWGGAGFPAISRPPSPVRPCAFWSGPERPAASPFRRARPWSGRRPPPAAWSWRVGACSRQGSAGWRHPLRSGRSLPPACGS